MEVKKLKDNVKKATDSVARAWKNNVWEPLKVTGSKGGNPVLQKHQRTHNVSNTPNHGSSNIQPTVVSPTVDLAYGQPVSIIQPPSPSATLIPPVPQNDIKTESTLSSHQSDTTLPLTKIMSNLTLTTEISAVLKSPLLQKLNTVNVAPFHFDGCNSIGAPHGLSVLLPLHNTHWQKIQTSLESLKESCKNNNVKNMQLAMISTIKAYCPDCDRRSNFGMLREELRESLMAAIPMIVDQALQLKLLLREPIPVLERQNPKTLFLTRRLCCSLLANAFFCTFPESISNTPDFNFFRLFNDTNSARCEVKVEKITCILNYFWQMHDLANNKKFQDQIVSFERRYKKDKVTWARETAKLCAVEVEINRKIEQAVGMLQADFANKVVGGGVLNDGSVMEEIRFCISPELLVSRLFTQTMEDDEAVIITGTEIFSDYTGYNTSFKYNGPASTNWEKLETDEFGRTLTQVVAMDAIMLRRQQTSQQFQPSLINRELHKASVAFMPEPLSSTFIITPVATGNWGCGAFNGNPELKFMIQWMAASYQKRPKIVYHTVRDKVQAERILEITQLIRKKGMSIRELYHLVLSFGLQGNHGSLFDHIQRELNKENRKDIM